MKIFHNLNHEKYSLQIDVYKKKIISNGSRRNFFFNQFLNINLKFNKFMFFRKKNWAGRTSTGRITVFSKGSKNICNNSPIINYSFRDNRLSFISNFIFIPKTLKFISTIVMPNGATTFVPTTTCHKLFVLKTFFTVDKHTKKVFISSTKTNPLYNFVKYITTLIDLPKNKPVCLLEQNPLKGIKYSRSSGSYSKILKMDSRTGLGIVKLTSGFTKIFSIHGLGSEGWVIPFDKLKFSCNKAGFYRNLGNKSIVRGVAKNPVDHPHGGRTKTLKYPRTPWGLTAKKK